MTKSRKTLSQSGLLNLTGDYFASIQDLNKKRESKFTLYDCSNSRLSEYSIIN